jgi:hypothetical protein
LGLANLGVLTARQTRLLARVGAVPVVMLALSIGTTGCGGGGESDEDAVREAFETHAEALAAGDVEAYCESFSDAELERTGISPENCLDLDPDSLQDESAGEATITSVSIEGDEATVEYELADGSKETGTIVQEDGDWKVSDLTFF